MSPNLAAKRKDRLAKEIGTVRKAWGLDTSSIALVYPNTYSVAMSNLGFQLVYRLLNERDDVLCERAFLPDREERPQFERSGRRLTSLESDRPLTDFDIIAFSVPFENDFPHILEILFRSKIPLKSADRGEEDPLIIAGGVTSHLNPEPVADFIDLFAVGEGEVIIAPFMEAFKKSRELPRRKRLKSLSQIKSIYVPSLYDVVYHDDGRVLAYKASAGVPERVSRAWLEEEALQVSRGGSSVLTEDTEFGDMYLVEVGRGCGRGCRFCAAGFINLPPRERKTDRLASEFEEGIAEGKRIGLISPSLADHPDIEGICRAIHESGGRSSLSAVRADALEEGYLSHIKKGKLKTVTIAPEAGTERMREVINKGLSDADILNAVALLGKVGIPNIRFYFMIGLPTEEAADIDGIIDITIRCRNRFIEESKVHKKVGNITLSVNCFVPKPFTPFQWRPMEDEKILKEKLRQIKKALGREPNIKMISDLPRWAHIQGLLSRGDRRLSDLLLEVHKNEGNWKKAIRDTGIDPAFYTARARCREELFPWDVLDIGLKKDYLWKEYERGLAGKVTPPCNIGACVRCGVC
ncbi:MAG: radical SAM protein [Deltaproteobacteria bacterium]|nr:radical SAM protein [Deltaproteobacteria bacterium]